MGQRRDRLDKRLARATVTRQKNSQRKTAERDRRNADMLAILKKGEFPYTPTIMSWLSTRLEKKANRIEAADVKALLKST